MESPHRDIDYLTRSDDDRAILEVDEDLPSEHEDGQVRPIVDVGFLRTTQPHVVMARDRPHAQVFAREVLFLLRRRRGGRRPLRVWADDQRVVPRAPEPKTPERHNEHLRCSATRKKFR